MVLPGNLAARHLGYFGDPKLHRRLKNNKGDEQPGYHPFSVTVYCTYAPPAIEKAVVIARSDLK
jgi:hypothetical protein